MNEYIFYTGKLPLKPLSADNVFRLRLPTKGLFTKIAWIKHWLVYNPMKMYRVPKISEKLGNHEKAFKVMKNRNQFKCLASKLFLQYNV